MIKYVNFSVLSLVSLAIVSFISCGKKTTTSELNVLKSDSLSISFCVNNNKYCLNKLEVKKHCDKKYDLAVGAEKLEEKYACYRSSTVKLVEYCDTEFWMSNKRQEKLDCYTAINEKYAERCNKEFWMSNKTEERLACYKIRDIKLATYCSDKYWTPQQKEERDTCYKSIDVQHAQKCHEKYWTPQEKENKLACYKLR